MKIHSIEIVDKFRTIDRVLEQTLQIMIVAVIATIVYVCET
jgi:hypothetical protein